jgi:outer membrane receptor protein involved in Fe transport
MRRISNVVSVAILMVAGCLSIGAAVGADVKAHFDLQSEPMDRALRDFALQANCNISFEPSLVVGLQAPAVKGEYSRGEALSLLLTGTALKALTVNDNTIQVVERGTGAEPDWKTAEKKDLEEIVVTGTHIRGGSTASPVMELGREEIDRSGYTSLADLMLSVPQNFGGGINPGTTVNNAPVNSRFADNPSGASVPNLRGLGPGSTLTLINGHRMASALAGGGADISSIPLDAIERVEIVTDSASAIYGSDAVAGVVNIILKRNYDGAKTSLSYGYATEGGGAEKGVSQMFGTHWNGGDAILAYEHRQQDPVYATDRAFTSTTVAPNSLLQATKSDSVTFSAKQDLITAASAFLDGVYVARDANQYITAPSGLSVPIWYSATLRKFAVTTGVDVGLWRDWKATLFVSDAEDNTRQTTLRQTSPVTPAGAEQFLGTLRGIEASANGGVGALPGGQVRLAIGAGYRRENFSAASGPDLGSLADTSAGGRNVRYTFEELSVPLVGPLSSAGPDVADLVISGRSERYSDFGSTTVPKIGLVYQPTSSLKLRSTWGNAFRAPNLNDIHGVRQLVILDLADPASGSGFSPVLYRSGGNPALRPETAAAWSVGADFAAFEDHNLQVSTTFFDVKYKNRISQIGNPFAALTDPANAFFVTPSPSAGYAQSVVNEYLPNEVYNYTGGPFVPGSIVAVVDARLSNVASQSARGADLSINYRIDAESSSTLLFLNGSYLDLVQRDTPESPPQTLSGLAFYPPKFRVRTGVTWKPASWAITGIVNYLAHETNTQVVPAASVASWTTIDASVRYSPTLKGLWSGFSLSLSALNVLNKEPPFVESSTFKGLNYDSSNVSPLGRMITLQVSKEW